jgi:hypothetical protein
MKFLVGTLISVSSRPKRCLFTGPYLRVDRETDIEAKEEYCNMFYSDIGEPEVVGKVVNGQWRLITPYMNESRFDRLTKAGIEEIKIIVYKILKYERFGCYTTSAIKKLDSATYFVVICGSTRCC